MHIRGIGMLRRWVRRAWLTTQPRAVILLYHRIAELSSDPQLLSVTPQHFAEHLEHICKYYHPMSLVQLGRALTTKRVPHHAVAITFDDGYADNLWNAKSLLEKYDVSVTVFVTTGYVGQNREFWWDDLERFLFLPEQLPERLTLTINGELHGWDLHKSEEHSTLRWDVTMRFCPSSRYKVYKELYRLLRLLDDEKQQEVLAVLAQWTGISRDGRAGYRALDSDELKELGDSRLVEIGSHSITHSVLTAQPLEERRREIFDSKQYLEDIFRHPVRSFSYPYGGAVEVDKDAIRLVQESGYDLACANFSVPITRRSNLYRLPRYLVRDWDGEEFAKRLKTFFAG